MLAQQTETEPIVVSNLTKVYEDAVVALEKLSLRVGPQEFYSLLGANGAGKTTLISILLGFTPPTDGAASLNGLDVQTFPLESRRRVAYLGEVFGLYDNLTVSQNIDFFLGLAGRSALSKEQRLASLAEVGLTPEWYHVRASSLSKGMRQKLGISISLLRGAEILLMDEPTSGLDPVWADEVLAVLGRVRNAGKTVFITTHDIFRARQVSDRLGILRSGRLVAEYSREDLAAIDLQSKYFELMQ